VGHHVDERVLWVKRRPFFIGAPPSTVEAAQLTSNASIIFIIYNLLCILLIVNYKRALFKRQVFRGSSSASGVSRPLTPL
jgi:hypothetical protein